jgi:hypothetical protein
MVWVLQLGAPLNAAASHSDIIKSGLESSDLARVARTVVEAPGPLGEAWILPWALGGWPEPVPIEALSPFEASREATELCALLAAAVWSLPAESALAAAGACLRVLRGPDPMSAVERLRRLHHPDREAAGRLRSLVAVVRSALVEMGAAADEESAWYLSGTLARSVLAGASHPPAARIGVGLWEPFVSAVVLANGRRARGAPASSGVGAGRLCRIDDPGSGSFRPRWVATGRQPTPDMAPLLWDAAGLVTASGSRAAHLFDSARALGVPAVCGVDLAEGDDEIVAVDGYAGVVSSLALRGDDDE